MTKTAGSKESISRSSNEKPVMYPHFSQRLFSKNRAWRQRSHSKIFIAVMHDLDSKVLTKHAKGQVNLISYSLSRNSPHKRGNSRDILSPFSPWTLPVAGRSAVKTLCDHGWKLPYCAGFCIPIPNNNSAPARGQLESSYPGVKTPGYLSVAHTGLWGKIQKALAFSVTLKTNKCVKKLKRPL